MDNRGIRPVLFLVGGLALGGCHSYEMRPMEVGYVATEGIRIEAEDGAFSFPAGAAFEPPFQVNTFGLRAASWNRDNIELQSLDAQRIGAERVRVHVPGRDEPLYGVLMLSEAPAESEAPAWRSYIVQVPDSAIAAALEGTSVVYEYGEIGEDNAKARRAIGGRGEHPEYHDENWFSWILWMSDSPFQELPAALEAMNPEAREAYAFDEGPVEGPMNVPLSSGRKRLVGTLGGLLASLLLLALSGY